MFYCTLLDLVLYLHKDERGFLKAQLTDNFHNAIRIHHSLATKAQDYNKKQHVFRLETAEQAEYLFQTRYCHAFPVASRFPSTSGRENEPFASARNPNPVELRQTYLQTAECR